ncbi:MAG: GIY-YIG nuclease family protein [Patescibacteria group bacterium]
MQHIKNKISKLPDAPGVYFFLRAPKPSEGGKPKILYIGKATSLRSRVKSYFNGRIEETRGPLISKMLSEFTDIKFQKTDSVLEALILEANLIKKHQPEANTDEKDDKSFNYVVITKEDWPRVLVMREKELRTFFSPHSSKSTDIFLLENSSCSAQSASQGFSQNDGSKKFSISKTFGPFTNGAQLKEAMKIVRKIFPFRDKCEIGQKRACFNRQIGLCSGVCTGEISKKDYGKQIKNIVLFFEGKKKALIKNLEKQMKAFSNSREYENAGKIKRQIFALYHIQDVSLIKSENIINLNSNQTFRIESYDIAHLSGTNVVGAMTVVENGEIKKTDYRKFKIRSATIDDTKALSEVLARRLNHSEWPMPDLIVVDGGEAQKRAVEKVLKINSKNIPVVSVVKDERHKPKDILGDKKWLKQETEILLANAEAHRFAISFHRNLRRKLS